MPFTASADFSAGTSKAALTDLSVQPLSVGDINNGPALTTGIVNRGRGLFGWYGTAPDSTVRIRLVSTSAGTLDVSTLDVVAALNADTTPTGVRVAALNAASESAIASDLAFQAVGTLDRFQFSNDDKVLAEGTGGGGSGNGDIAVTHAYPGSTGLVNDADGNPADNVLIRAYVKTAYDADELDPAAPSTYTGSDGLWIRPLNLDPDTYTLTLYNPVTKITDVLPELEVTA